MAAIDFPTATSNGQTFEADSGVIYTYVGTPPNGFWSGTFATTGLNTLDGRYIAKNDENNIQTIQTQGLKLNSGNGDTILLDGLNGKIGIGTTSPDFKLDVNGTVGITEGQTVSWHDGAGSLAARIYASSTDELRFEIGSSASRAMTIDSAGKVGIGTSSPSEKLEVAGSVGNIQLKNSGAEITFTRNDGNFITASGASGYLGFQTGGTNERIRITAVGDVGIGSTAPLTTLECRGQFSVSNNSSSYWVLDRDDSDGRLKLLDSSTSTNEKLAIDSSGRLLVGTTTEGQANADNLTIADSGTCGITLRSASNNFGRIYFSDGTSGDAEYRGIIQYDHSNDRMQFAANASTAMTIDSSGRVGIGTSDADELLHVANTGGGASILLETNNSSGGNILFGDADSNTVGRVQYVHSDNSMRLFTNSSERMRIDSAGNVGVGTTNPLVPFVLSHDGNINIEMGYSSGGAFPSNYLQSYNRGTSAYAPLSITGSETAFFIASTERMRIDTNGNVKIGTTTDGAGAGFATRIAVSGADTSIFKTAGVGASSAAPLRAWHDATSGNNLLQMFHTDTALNTRGTITYNRSGNLIQYNTTSDARLKTNITDASSALSDLGQVRVRSFDWIEEGHNRVNYGFVAQELNAIAPYAVNEGDHEDEVIQQWGVSNSNMVPLLTKALQESITKIEALEAVDHDQFQNTSALLNQPLITFLNNSGAVAGEVIHSGINSVTYATSSDHRLKENVTDLTAAIPRLKNLAPKRFNFIGADEVTVDGFLAHEAQTVVPEAVTGTHNEVDGDGNAVMQGIDQAKLVPLLTAALQEAITKIETLETKVAALEAA